MTNKSEYYQKQIISVNQKIAHLLKAGKYLPLVRLITFILFLVLFYKILINNSLYNIGSSVLLLIVFFTLTWRDTILKKKLERLTNELNIYNNEIQALNGDLTHLDPGENFIEKEHRYAYDLDLFGEKSLFHLLNRSSTIFGKKRLEFLLKNAIDFKDVIWPRQDAVKELAYKFEFRVNLQLAFFGLKSNVKEPEEIKSWLQHKSDHLSVRSFKVIRTAFPVITIVLIFLSLAGIIPFQFPVLFFTIQLLITAFYARKTIGIQTLVSSKVRILSRYTELLKIIENEKFSSTLLIAQQNRLISEDSEKPSAVMDKIVHLLNWVDSNLNILVAVLLNGLFLFNLQLLAAIEEWKLKYKDQLPEWFEVIAEIEALTSVSNFAFNNSHYIYPELSVNQYFYFKTTNLGHPLIPEGECITNSIEISGWHQYGIITGANMSGKSTFLRTVGTNYILAMIGGPVYASQFVFTPVLFHSSIRTNDSLAKRESYFYAELKRLKEIIVELQEGKQVFVLLDEILKGTNSRDKQSGSIALLRQLIKYQSVGLVATHDLVLGDLAENYPSNIANYSFEIQITDSGMEIDYKLHKGVCKNLNATYLMNMMGILADGKI